MAFLNTRVKYPTDEYWKILMRVLAYLKRTLEECLALSTEDTKIIKWWVDGLYATYGDMRSHTGGMVSMGKGIIYDTSHKQKLNTKR